MKACTLFGVKDLRLVEQPESTDLLPEQVRLRYRSGGICGSDIHYYYHGRAGNFTLQEPLVLGHEVSGEVLETGSEVTDLVVGQRIAINPNLPCLECEYCLAGHTNLCEKMVFFGSAAVFPHIQGGFREQLVVPRRQCVPLPDNFDFTTAAFAEPLAICLHAVNRAAPVTHKRVLVTGSGPIGCMTMMAARMAGARQITATDIEDGVLSIARSLSADETINIVKDSDRIEKYESARGYFDVAFECSGNPQALQTCMNAVKPRGKIVQVGIMPPEANPIPVNKMLAKELHMTGTFRFHEEFNLAVEALVNKKLDVSPLLTGVYDFADVDAAFTAAIDRSQHMKIQLQFKDNL